MSGMRAFPGYCFLVLFCLCSRPLASQQPLARLSREIGSTSRRVALPGSRPPQVLRSTAQELSAVPTGTAVNGLTLVFRPSDAQGAVLKALASAQLDPASPLFHQWLTPEEYAGRFGLAESDLAKIRRWLEGQGFRIDAIERSRDRMTFSGTTGQVASAFGTALTRYRIRDEEHVAPASDLSLPEDLAPLVSAVLHLDDFRPQPQVHVEHFVPQYTAAASQAHYLDPADLTVEYDIKPLYASNHRGFGQTIAVVGQSWINASDVSAFSFALGDGSISPRLVLVPNSGVQAAFHGDQTESSIDVEYSSAVAPLAGTYFVFTGTNPAYNVFDALAYSITNDIAPVISISYGGCELDTSASAMSALTQLLTEASVQGQTVVAAAGDLGSTSCSTDTRLSAVQEQTPAVMVPANLANVTAVGGLQMTPDVFAAGSTQYFSSATGSDTISSLQTYAPETVWNEDSAARGIAAGGGGISTLVPRPAWQNGIANIAGSFRLMPDIALQASITSPGYVFCSSDPASFASGQINSCYNGSLTDSVNKRVSLAGGTSFAAPIFAGMVTLMNEVSGSAGSGNVNPLLYQLAANSTTASAFHDITTGGNQCTLGASVCSGAAQTSYAAGPGYDLASGLGSIDVAKLAATWPVAHTATQIPTQVLVAASPQGANISVMQPANMAVLAPNPTGTLRVLLDGLAVQAAAPISASTAQVTYTAPLTSGSHVVTAIYAGDAYHAPATGSGTFDVGTLTATGTITLSGTNISVPANGTGTGTIMVTPAGGYTGLVNFQLAVTSATPALCYRIGQVSTGTGMAGSTHLTLGTGTACGTTAALGRPAKPGEARGGIALAGLPCIALLLSALSAKRRRIMPGLFAVLGAAVCMGLSGCGGGSGSGSAGGSTPAAPSTQTVTLRVTGSDSVEKNITGSTTLTVTVGQ